MPKEDRTAMFRYLYGLPIQLTAYGHPITYKTIGTVLVAILAAFVSKILLQEMNKVLKLSDSIIKLKQINMFYENQ